MLRVAWDAVAAGAGSREGGHLDRVKPERAADAGELVRDSQGDRAGDVLVDLGRLGRLGRADHVDDVGEQADHPRRALGARLRGAADDPWSLPRITVGTRLDRLWAVGHNNVLAGAPAPPLERPEHQFAGCAHVGLRW